MTLTVLEVAYPFAPVSPDAVGGAEQVVSLLDAALVHAGYRSVVVAREGSSVRGVLVAAPGVEGALTAAARERAHRTYRRVVAAALRRFPVDVVHMHGIDFHAYLPATHVPVVVTLHLPPAWYPLEVYRPRAGVWMHCVSAAQRRQVPAGAPLLPDIPNGVPVDRLPAPVSRRGFALALGRVCPEKGFHLALGAARAADVSLFLGGEVFAFPAHRRYFDREIRPRLDHRRRFLGPVGFRRKRRLLSAARCLLVPSLAPETSSLVAMEALACGTPVIAFPAGALPEIVEDGRTGFLAGSEREMAEAIRAAGTIDPEACRAAARERFSAAVMAARHLALYEELARRVGEEAHGTAA